MGYGLLEEKFRKGKTTRDWRAIMRKGGGARCLKVLFDIANDPGEATSDRIAAAKFCVEFGFGKNPQMLTLGGSEVGQGMPMVNITINGDGGLLMGVTTPVGDVPKIGVVESGGGESQDRKTHLIEEEVVPPPEEDVVVFRPWKTYPTSKGAPCWTAPSAPRVVQLVAGETQETVEVGREPLPDGVVEIPTEEWDL